MSRFFTKFIVSAFLIIGFTTASFAQDEANMARPNTKAGSAAWMFSFGGLASLGMNGFFLGGFNIDPGVTTFSAQNVYGAGWKWYLADNMALRAMLGLNTTSAGDADPTKDPNGKRTTTIFGIGVGIEFHTTAVYSISPYFGGQITFASGSGDKQVTPSGGTTTENKESGTAFGIAALAGFDWYFTRGLAVGGEYTLGFSSTSTSVTTTSGSTTTTTSLPSSSVIAIGSASVHLIAHF